MHVFFQMFKVDFAEIRTDIDTLNASSHQVSEILLQGGFSKYVH